MHSEDGGTSSILSVERVVLRVLGKYLRGRSCHLTDDGSLILGPSTAEKGDHIFVFLSFNSPLVLRRVDDIPNYRIIDLASTPRTLRGRRCWAHFLLVGRYGLKVAGRGTIHRGLKIRTLQDPRLGPFPLGRKEKVGSKVDLGWLLDSTVGQVWIHFHHRLQGDVLKSCGVCLDRIFFFI